MSGKFALIIANTEYGDAGLAQLTAPGQDAEDFARVLKDPAICSFDEVNVLLNQPDYQIRVAIYDLFHQKKPDDLLVLYFSGHGVRDEFGSLYLAVKNTNRSKLAATAVDSAYITRSMDQSRSKRMVLILDCCNSGAFEHGMKAATGVSIGTATAFDAGSGRIILTASDSTQYAWEGDKIIGETENSLFTHFLVAGLEGEADLNSDGRITVDELYDYAYGRVKLATPKQSPSKFSSKQQGEIVLRRITRIEDIKPISLPEDLLEAVEDSRTFVREGAVRELEKLLKGKNLGLARSARGALERIEREDDSRRVSQAATQALESTRKAEEITLQTVAREGATAEKAEVEQESSSTGQQLSQEVAESETKESEEASPGTGLQVEPSSLNSEKAADEQAGRAEAAVLTPEASSQLEAIPIEVSGEVTKEPVDQVHEEAVTKHRSSRPKAERKRMVYIIVEEGIPLYDALPAANNWTVWLNYGSQLILANAKADSSRIGMSGHYIEVWDSKGSKGFVEAAALGSEKPAVKKVEKLSGLDEKPESLPTAVESSTPVLTEQKYEQNSGTPNELHGTTQGDLVEQHQVEEKRDLERHSEQASLDRTSTTEKKRSPVPEKATAQLGNVGRVPLRKDLTAKRPWLKPWTIATVVVALVLCGFAAALSFPIYFLNSSNVRSQTTSTPQAQIPVTGPTRTAVAKSTSLALTDTALAEQASTVLANSTNTAIARSKSTAVAQTTRTAVAMGTIQARNRYAADLEAAGQLLYGPESGSIRHNPSDEFVSLVRAEAVLSDFILKVSIRNPYSPSTIPWDYAIGFRDGFSNNQYRLIITSEKQWELLLFLQGSNAQRIQDGELPNLKVNARESNTIQLYCQDAYGLLYVNGDYIAELDLSARDHSGNIWLGTNQYENAGSSTDFREFSIWKLP